jgi:predicted Zn-dependent protease
MPVAVIAAEPEGEAQIIFLADEAKGTPDSLGTEFAKVLQEKYNIQPIKNEATTINGFDAYEIRFADNSGSKPVIYQVYWVQTDVLLFNVMGVSYPNHVESVNGIVQSMRKLTDDEKAGISGKRIRVATAIEGESIEELSSRTNNTWNKEATILMNDLKTDTALKEGQLLKIAVEEAYLGQ